MPDELIRRTEAIYRAELAKGCPAAADDRLFRHEIAKACAYWTIYAFEFYGNLWEADWDWGTSSVRQRMLTRLDLLAQATVDFDYLPALGETARQLAQRLRQQGSS